MRLSGRVTHFVFKPFQNGSEHDEGVAVFSNWILETLFEKPDEQFLALDILKEQLADALELDFDNSQRTASLFKSALTYLQATGFIATHDALKTIGITKSGRTHIKELLDKRQDFEQKMLMEFLSLIYEQSPAFHNDLDLDKAKKKHFIEGLQPNKEMQEYLTTQLNHIAHLRGEEYVERVIISKQHEKKLTQNQQFQTAGSEEKQPPSFGNLISPVDGPDFQIGLERAAKLLYEMGDQDIGRYPSIDYWFWLHNYESLFRRLWPDKEMRHNISAAIQSLYVYLDTSVIVAALCESDTLHRRARAIIDFLEFQKAKIFWLAPTDRELKAHIELARRLVEMIEPESRSPHEIQHLLEVAEVPSLTRAFIQGDVRNWRRFQNNIMQGYSELRSMARDSTKEVIDVVAKDELFKELQGKVKVTMLQLLRESSHTKARSESVLEHDANVLASIEVLRDAPPRDFSALSKGPNQESARRLLRELVWLVSFDRGLFQVTYNVLTPATMNFLNKAGIQKSNERDNVPLVLLYDTILMFMDPFIVSKEFYQLERPQGPRLRPLSTVKDIKDAVKDHYNRMQITKDMRETINNFSNQLAHEIKEIDLYQVIDESF